MSMRFIAYSEFALANQRIAALEAERDEWRAKAESFLPIINEMEVTRHELLARVKELETALTGDECPQLWRIEWLAGLMQEIHERNFGWIIEDPDPDATVTMLIEIEELVTLCRAALSTAKQDDGGQQS